MLIPSYYAKCGAIPCRANHYLRIYMAHLRQKLEADPARPLHLLTATSIGYRFAP